MTRTSSLEEHHKTHEGKKGTKKGYVVTFDLPQKIKLLRSIGIKTPDVNDPIFTEIQAEMIKKFKSYFPESEIIAISMQELADDILMQAVNKKKLLQHGTVVSTCSEISRLRKGYTVEINRLIDQNGNILGLGPRPGYPPLNDQINALVSIANGDPLILVEDGSFTGSTVLYMLKKIKEHNLTVSAIVLGFAFPEAVRQIRKVYDGELILTQEAREYVDWMPDHDFFPFVPNCGRVVGVKWRDQQYPFYTYNGASYSVPYLLTYCPFSKWTSIPDKYSFEFSTFCARAGANLFGHIERLNKEKITLGDLMNVQPRASVAITINQAVFPSLDTPVSSYYMDILHSLS